MSLRFSAFVPVALHPLYDRIGPGSAQTAPLGDTYTFAVIRRHPRQRAFPGAITSRGNTILTHAVSTPNLALCEIVLTSSP